jgi:hypothetical protein
MPKPPRDIPKGECGERVTLRANSARHGTIARVTEPVSTAVTSMWLHVDWDDGKRAPKICHQYELKQLPVDGS